VRTYPSPDPETAEEKRRKTEKGTTLSPLCSFSPLPLFTTIQRSTCNGLG
jgi:hypothetical protein